MKPPFLDSLFIRLFLLIFFVFFISFWVGQEILEVLDLSHRPAGASYNPFRWQTWLIRAFASAVTAWVAARWVCIPIQRIAQAADEFGNNLTAAPLDEQQGAKEIRQVAQLFNQMQVRLKRKMQERNLFLAAVSHDLRTPLTRLRLRVEKIPSAALREDAQRDIGEMSNMIDSTLEYLRNEKQSDVQSRFDISALLDSLAEDAQENGENLTVSGQAAPILLYPLAIRRCLNNLLENALRYGGQARVSISENAQQVIIRIQDAGPGIPEDKLEAVFEPFFRLEDSRNRHTGGVGLGLSIARDMAKKNGGELILSNAAEGGLIATLSLPKN